MKPPKQPEHDKKPKSLKESIFTFTPIALTVLSTLLAGLSSSEMTRSQVFRALAAQDQSKASDQWNYYQAKRLRADDAANSLDLLQAVATTPPTMSQSPRLPDVTDQPITNADILEAMKEVDGNQTEEQMAPVVMRISDQQIADALALAHANLIAFIAAVQPMNTELTSASGASAAVSRLQFAVARYDREAEYNRVSGRLYEIEVRRAGVQSDRRKSRSGYFFYGMLAAQAGVIISSFALAVEKRAPFWALAALSGVAALAFSSYVYMYM